MSEPATPPKRRFPRWILVPAYLTLLLLSHLFQWVFPRSLHEWNQRPDFAGVSHRSGTAGAPPVLLIVDPRDASHQELPALRAALGPHYQLHEPQLPGLHLRERRDATFDRLAHGIGQAWRSNALPPAHLVANGHAGSVAIHLAANYPDLVKSLVLIDASGVQELDLLGQYHLNHALYAISYYTLRFGDLFFPHFGFGDAIRSRQAQLGLLLNSDRRILRDDFRRIDAPVLITQNARALDAPTAADEHMRLLPQSTKVDLRPGESVIDALPNFFTTVESGEAPRRSRARPERVDAASAAFDPSSIPKPEGTMLFVLLLAIALATLVTEDATCVITGLMIANGNLTFAQGCGACLAGILFGDFLLFMAGRLLGRPALNRRPICWMIAPMKVREAEAWFQERGGLVILISRFLPGTRLPTFLAAGILGMRIPLFLAFFVPAAAIWTPSLIWLAVGLSETALRWIDRYRQTAPAVLLGLVLAYFLFKHLLLPSFNWRGRCHLRARWRRWTHPEYWPTWTLYTPVVLYLIGRSLRRGNRLLDFTACNPCMPASGVVEESKSDILGRFRDRGSIARYTLLPTGLSAEERLARVEEFQAGLPKPFPLVLKPDVGQRGSQVSIVRSREQIERVLHTALGDMIVQEYAPGVEYGVLYYRYPDQDHGKVFAITIKEFTTLTGDGHHTMEDLILKDKRAACQARIHMRYLRERLFEIPAVGEVVPLTEVGNHARGTLFRNGISLLTAALEERIDAISRSIDGFYYGRYDLRVQSLEEFQSGRNVKIIELNGVTSEATSLYDPENSYLDMVTTLLKQWKTSSEIGRANREAGHPIATARSLLHDYSEYRKREAEIRARQR